MYYTTKTTYVDIETGEELIKQHIENKIYEKLSFTTKWQDNGTTKEKHNCWKCRKITIKQLELF